MTAPAAPPIGRRVSLGAAAVLAGFLLLAPPLYVLGPFALLTLLSRPRKFREWAWAGLALYGVAIALSAGAALGPRILRTSGVALSVTFAVLSFRARGSVLPRALGALALSALALAVWGLRAGITWDGVEQAFTELLRGSYAFLVDRAGTDPASRRSMEEFVKPFMEGAPGVARLMPGFLAVEALAGLGLASFWHHRIAEHPIGQAPAPFTTFRFNDQLIWGAIFSVALLLIPLPPTWAAVAANLLVVWMGLYAARGLAVVSAVLAPAPLPLRILTGGLALLMLPVVLGATVALGLADTWVDIRGRLLPPATRGA